MFQNPPISKSDRDPSTLVDTPNGKVHYRLEGPDNGRPLVLVHGFSSPLFGFDPIMPALHAAEFRTLRFDLFGRGQSDRPSVTYDLDLFRRQFLDVKAALGFPAKTDILGWSMGGAITVSLAEHFPQVVDRIVLLAPAGMPVGVGPLRKLLLFPGIGEAFIAAFGERVLKKGIDNNFAHKEHADRFKVGFFPQMEYRGYKRSLLSTLRNVPLDDMRDAFRAVGEQGRRILLVWGTADAITPFDNADPIDRLLGGVTRLDIGGAGHAMHWEHTDEVSDAIVEHLLADR